MRSAIRPHHTAGISSNGVRHRIEYISSVAIGTGIIEKSDLQMQIAFSGGELGICSRLRPRSARL